MLKLFGILIAAGVFSTGLFFASARAEDTTTKPAATQASLPACCGADCKKMTNCCTTDDKGKVTCGMGGSCCVKADDKKADDKGTSGMNMGK